MRVTGGVYRSRALRAPRGDRTRPTSDRVREALFGILGAKRGFTGARVLDLYAGTGALAIEALSRGAERAVLVESARPAVEVIAGNLAALGLTARARVLPMLVEKASAALGRDDLFDLVLVDPPYALVPSGAATRALEGLARAGLFAPDAIVVLEHAQGDVPPAMEHLTLRETRRYGDTSLTFYDGASSSVAP
jgi:16S rRNA (guanine(966)-N(2))-methyltransferase RsmD